MAYQPPELDELINLAHLMKREYTGSNAKRLALIERYDYLVGQAKKSKQPKDTVVNKLMGALLFILNDIKLNEYSGKKAKKHKILFWDRGSDLYTLIKTKLRINKQNKISPEARLFYIYEYDKVMSSLSEFDWQKFNSHFPHLIWKTKKDYLNDMDNLLNLVLKVSHTQFDNLVHGVPLLKPLLENLQKLEQAYNSVNPVIKNQNRRETLNCVSVVLKSYEGKNPDVISWHACVGTAIVTLMQIDDEYRILSPKGGIFNKGSKLYQDCSEAINKDLKDITLPQKIVCVQNLSSYLTTLMSKQSYYHSILNEVIDSHYTNKQTPTDTERQNEIAQLDKEIHAFREQTDRYLKKLNDLNNSPTCMQHAVSTGVYYATTSALGPLLFSISRHLVVNSLKIGGYIVSGTVGTALFSMSGVLLASGLSRLLKQGLIETVTANLCVWLLDKIGYTITKTTMAIAPLSYSTTPDGFAEMRQKLKPEDDIAFVNYVNTLLELPQVSEKEKHQIRFVLGLQPTEVLSPLDNHHDKVNDNVNVQLKKVGM